MVIVLYFAKANFTIKEKILVPKKLSRIEKSNE